MADLAAVAGDLRVDDKAYQRYMKRMKKAKGNPRKVVRAGKKYVRDNITAHEKKGKGCVITMLALGAGAVAAWRGWV